MENNKSYRGQSDDMFNSSPEDITFEELFDLGDLQLLQDQFAAAASVASIITRPDGTPISKPSNYGRCFNEIILKTSGGQGNCFRPDTETGKPSPEEPTIYPGLNSGLWDSGVGIFVGEKHVANWLIGQVRDEAPGENEISTKSGEQFVEVSQLLITLVNQLSANAYKVFQQTRTISMAQQAENAFRQSTTHHRILVETIPDLVWLKDRDGIYLSCNHTFERLYGAREADIIGKTDYDFVGRELADFFRLHDRKAMEADAPSANEEWLTFAEDGYKGLFETIKTPMRDTEGNLIGILGIARDVTERQKAEQDLRESEERYRSLHNASFGGIAIHDKGVILECNQGLSSMTGYSVEELIGMDGLLLIAEQSRDLVMENIVGGNEHAYEARGLRKDGEEYPMRLEARNVPYKGKQVRTVEFRDISEMKQAEDQQRHLQNQLNQSQKMESVGQLAGGIAHDFNNLLQVILGYGDIALESVEKGCPSRPPVEQIMQAGGRARTLVAQLLAFSRRQVLDMKDVDLNEVVGDMLKFLRRIIGAHIELQFLPGKDLGVFRADSGRMGQIVTNLCVNARDAMPDGGRISIETANVVVDEENRAAHFWVDPDRYVMLSVTDNGCGMDQATQVQVFEPFFTTKDVDKGTGLGLSTVYGLVKQHHGFVHVRSELDKGTTFNIYLPQSEGGMASSSTITARSAKGGTETILLAEDDEMVRSLTVTMLERNGYRVLPAENGEEALAVYERHADEIDLLLLDVIMPVLGGRAVYDRIRETNPDIPTLFASGYSMNVVNSDFNLDEGLVLIQKPASSEELLRKVREVLDAS